MPWMFSPSHIIRAQDVIVEKSTLLPQRQYTYSDWRPCLIVLQRTDGSTQTQVRLPRLTQRVKDLVCKVKSFPFPESILNEGRIQRPGPRKPGGLASQHQVGLR